MESNSAKELEAEIDELTEFKNFLQTFANEAGTTTASSAELRNFSRNNNDTYQVSSDELHGEVVMIIWNHLINKQCPTVFQIPMLRSLVHEIAPACLTSKECEIEKSSDETVVQYDLAKLQKFVLRKVEEFFIKLTDNAEQENLMKCIEAKIQCESGQQRSTPKSATSTLLDDGGEVDDDGFGSSVNQILPAHAYVSGQIKNKPRKMEDRIVCLDRFSAMFELCPLFSFYGVFDGHSGPLAATYVSTQLPQILANELKLRTPSSTDEYRNLLEESFQLADYQFAEKGISSGTTATVALLAYENEDPDWPKHLYVAWVGDSKALLVSATVNLQLVKPHKPNNADERKRIEEAGGSVLFIQGQWRVNGVLNVARSIGDCALNVVIAEPDFVDIPITKSHDFLVLASDGLWDHVTEAKIAETVYEALIDETQKLDNIPKLLIDLAKEGDSQDNITVIVVFLNKPSTIMEHYKKAKNTNEKSQETA